MNAKKTKKANLENKKILFFELGLIVVLSFLLLAFNWKSPGITELKKISRDADDIIELTTITTSHDEIELPKQKIESHDLKILDDTEELKNAFEVKDISDNPNRRAEEFKLYIPEPIIEDHSKIIDDFIVVPEVMPSFPGGDIEMLGFIQKNIKYPRIAIESEITGKVYLSFIVEKNGSLSNIKILRDIGGGCGKEALRVVNLMPNWIPGKQRGTPVRVEVSIPISFVLK